MRVPLVLKPAGQDVVVTSAHCFPVHVDAPASFERNRGLNTRPLAVLPRVHVFRVALNLRRKVGILDAGEGESGQGPNISALLTMPVSSFATAPTSSFATHGTLVPAADNVENPRQLGLAGVLHGHASANGGTRRH